MFEDGILTVEDIFIEEGSSAVVSVWLDYGLKFQYTDDQPYDKDSQNTYFAGYAFAARVNSLRADYGTVAAVGKKVTAIGGFMTTIFGVPKAGLTIEIYDRDGVFVDSAVSSLDGFYFVEVPAGTYDVEAYNSFGHKVGEVKDIRVKKDRYVAVNFDHLSPADPVIEGFVTSEEGALAGVEVQLLNKKGKVLASTTTNLAGYYSFIFTQPGNYMVAVVAPEVYVNPVPVSLKIKQFEVMEVNFFLNNDEF